MQQLATQTYITYWIFLSKTDNFCTSFYSRSEALDWIEQQPATNAYDIVRIETCGTKTTSRTVQSVDRRKA